MKFDKYLDKQLKNPNIKKEFDRLAPEYEIISAVMKSRKNLGITQLELAKKIGTDQAHISRLERGNSNPSLNFLKKIADGLGQELHISFKPKTIK